MRSYRELFASVVIITTDDGQSLCLRWSQTSTSSYYDSQQCIVGAGTMLDERVSEGVGTERSSWILGRSNVVYAVKNGKNSIRVAPVGRRRPGCPCSHWLEVEHYRWGVMRLGYNHRKVVEVVSKLSTYPRVYTIITLSPMCSYLHYARYRHSLARVIFTARCTSA